VIVFARYHLRHLKAQLDASQSSAFIDEPASDDPASRQRAAIASAAGDTLTPVIME
jgi:hypothetical protein